jgi:hypothetical protein
MKKIKSLFLLSTLGAASIFTACDKEDETSPLRASQLIANNDNYTTLKNQALQFNVLTNDSIGNNATVTITQAGIGTVQAGSIPGAFTYQPQNNFIGIDSFSYEACVGVNCATAKVFIEVKEPVAPCSLKAVVDTIAYYGNKPLNTVTLDILKNDELCGGTDVTPTITVHPGLGQAVINANNQLVFTPPATRPNPGHDGLRYKITGANGTSEIHVFIYY